MALRWLGSLGSIPQVMTAVLVADDGLEIESVLRGVLRNDHRRENHRHVLACFARQHAGSFAELPEIVLARILHNRVISGLQQQSREARPVVYELDPKAPLHDRYTHDVPVGA